MSLISFNALGQLLFFFSVILLCIKPLGAYIARVYSGQMVFLEHIFGPIEDVFYRYAGVDPMREMNWQEYAIAIVLASLGGILLLFGILKCQAFLPLNPQHFPNLNSGLAFNIAISFVTNTNWQSYTPENTLSYFSQMMGLGVQNFLSASMGLAVAMTLVRSLTRKNTPYIGNFWVDWLRGSLYLLLPLALLLAIALSSQGVIQNFNPYLSATPVEPLTSAQEIRIPQIIPGGPVASQVAIKQLGSNGGGFFNVNAAHPFENPTPFSNFLEMLAILLLPCALFYTFGVMVNDRRQGWLLIGAMFAVFLPLFLFGMWQEQTGNPLLDPLSVDQQASSLQPGGNMEGKEVRLGILNSTLWSSLTTATSNGSVNSMLEAYLPYGYLVPMLFLSLSEVIFGGVGAGLYGMLTFVVITVFVAGLMVGRTPTYLGKKIQSFDIKMASIVMLVPMLCVLLGTTLATLVPAGQAGISNPGAQGFSEILYALYSTANNNGSALAGLQANSPFYHLLLGFSMLFGRFWTLIPVLAIAGSLAAKNVSHHPQDSLATHTPLFGLLLIGIILLVGLLTYVPVLTLGPITEHFNLLNGGSQ